MARRIVLAPGTHAGGTRRRAFTLTTALALAAAPLAWGIDLRQTPPAGASPFVPPNVILSIDDSAGMARALAGGSDGNNAQTPDDPEWGSETRRVNVLKHALTSLFSDGNRLPDGKIRLAWQAMWNNGNAAGVGDKAGDSSSDIQCVQYRDNDPKECEAFDVANTPIKRNQGGADSVTKNNAESDPGHGSNSMRPLDGAHRENFRKFAASLTPGGNVLAHRLFMKADRYLRAPLGPNSPWASNPGGSDAKSTEYLGCRRNYHLFIGSGAWDEIWPDDGIGNADHDAALPYRDSHENTLADWAFHSWNDPLQAAATLSGALAVPADYASAAATETFTTNGSSASIHKRDNPRFDPNTRPHLSTYVIGFGPDAWNWPESGIEAPGAGSRLPFVFGGPDGGSFVDLVNGTRTWPELAVTTSERNPLDLWHAALNGRGRFYAVEQPDDLERALADVLAAIQAQSVPAPSRSAAIVLTGTSNRNTPVVGFTTSSTFDPERGWSGDVRPQVIDTADGICTAALEPAATPGCATWGVNASAAALLDARPASDARNIITADHPAGPGIKFEWDALSAQQQDSLRALQGEDDVNAKNRLAYVRGDRTQEIDQGGAFRNRASRLGAISDSTPWLAPTPSSLQALPGYREFARQHAGRTPMLYVGANDGMLHGFSTTGGAELFAYIPRALVPALKNLADPAFNSQHRAYVNGSPFTGDADLRGSGAYDWRTLLVGTLGAGGQGYFVLDVTRPDQFSGTNVLLDKTQMPADSDRTTRCKETPDQDACDLGHITARPATDADNPNATTQITRLNNGRWAVLLGNGYNSENRRPVLLIQYLDGERQLQRITAPAGCAAQPGADGAAEAAVSSCDNGLSTPRAVDIDGNGTADVAYAGDNVGNLWKFDLTAPSDTEWKVAFAGEPLFTALGPDKADQVDGERTRPQPITVAPLVRASDRSMEAAPNDGPTEPQRASVRGLMVAFGTGRNVASADASDPSVQTLYAVLDRTTYQFAGPEGARHLTVASEGDGSLGADDLARRTIALDPGVSDAESIEVPDGQELSPAAWATRRGWYLDLPGSGERIVEAPTFYRGSNLMTIWSEAPALAGAADLESCAPPAETAATGKTYRTFINIMDGAAPSVPLLFEPGTTTLLAANHARRAVARGAHALVSAGDHQVLDIAATGPREPLADLPERSLRPSWRQLQ